MSLLQFIIIVAALIFVLFGIDLYKRKKATLLHFLVFIGGGAVLALFGYDIDLLNKFGTYFGVTRGADLIVYASIILLFYFFIDLYNRLTKDITQLSKLVTQQAVDQSRSTHHMQIEQYKNNKPEDDFVFLIRAYNEAQTIGTVIENIIKAWYNKILIVNDGSTDTTQDVIQEKQTTYPDALIIDVRHAINRWDRGAWAATKTGFAFLQQHGADLQIKRVVWFDADGQMDIADMKNFTKAIQEQKVDLYLGSRFIAGAAAYQIPTLRKYILGIAKVVVRLMYSNKVSDPHNGYRVMSLVAIQKFKLQSDGMHYANELNEQIVAHRMSYLEIPVHIHYTDYSLQKWQKNSNSIRLAIEMLYKKFFYR